ncbi:MAG: hypothetical protein ABSC33_10595 [Candidatus Sulfotelmatobacter sp.]|jgi:outer membrane biosynthesis protein TonB
MILAASLVIYFLALNAPHSETPSTFPGAVIQDQGAAPNSQNQTPTAPTTPPPSSNTPTAQPQTSPPAPKHRRHKKASTPDCQASSATTDSKSGSQPASPNNPEAANLKPCPPPKVVVKNGGTDAPTVELKGNTTAAQASYERYTTDQLTAGTEENLKKIAGRQLTPSQQATINQIKEFMEKSKAAIAEGDLERGRDLAMKAHLLSDELVNP